MYLDIRSTCSLLAVDVGQKVKYDSKGSKYTVRINALLTIHKTLANLPVDLP